MKLSLHRSASISLYQQVYIELRNKILSKELQAGKKLPSERVLAKTLDVDRSTVVKAYDILKSDGLIQSFKGKGTYIVYSENKQEKHQSPLSFFDWRQCFEKKNKNKHDDIIRLIMDSDIRKDKCFFAGGLPDDHLIPHKTFQQLGEKCINDASLNVLAHSAVSGVSVLKHQIKTLMEERDIYTSVNEQIITSGSQQALDLVFRSFVEEGDVVLVEEPAFFGALQLLRQVGAKIIQVPMDEDGMQMDILAFMIATHKPKFIYTTPTYHNPTGIVMSLERRFQLIELSNQYHVPIIEDDPYGDMLRRN